MGKKPTNYNATEPEAFKINIHLKFVTININLTLILKSQTNFNATSKSHVCAFLNFGPLGLL